MEQGAPTPAEASAPTQANGPVNKAAAAAAEAEGTLKQEGDGNPAPPSSRPWRRGARVLSREDSQDNDAAVVLIPVEAAVGSGTSAAPAGGVPSIGVPAMVVPVAVPVPSAAGPAVSTWAETARSSRRAGKRLADVVDLTAEGDAGAGAEGDASAAAAPPPSPIVEAPANATVALPPSEANATAAPAATQLPPPSETAIGAGAAAAELPPSSAADNAAAADVPSLVLEGSDANGPSRASRQGRAADLRVAAAISGLLGAAITSAPAVEPSATANASGLAPVRVSQRNAVKAESAGRNAGSGLNPASLAPSPTATGEQSRHSSRARAQSPGSPRAAGRASSGVAAQGDAAAAESPVEEAAAAGLGAAAAATAVVRTAGAMQHAGGRSRRLQQLTQRAAVEEDPSVGSMVKVCRVWGSGYSLKCEG